MKDVISSYNEKMRRLWEQSHWGAVFLPLLFLLAANVFPRPWAADFALSQAHFRLDAGRYDLASTSLIVAAEKLPDTPGIWQKAGMAAYLAGQYPASIDALVKAKSLNQVSTLGLTTLGDAYAATNQLDQALRVWQTVLEISVPTPEIFKRLQITHAKQENYAAMIGDVEAALDIQPDNSTLLYQLGLLLAVYQPDQAAPYLAHSARVEPKLSSKVQSLESGLLLASQSQDPAYRFLLIGRTLGSIGVWDLAAAAMQRSVDANPQYAEAWAFLGEAHQQLRRDGFTELQRAIDLNPKSVLAQALMSMYWRRQGKPDQALVYLQNAAGLEPDNPVWQVELAVTTAQTGQLDKALTIYQHAVQLAPSNPVYLRTLAEFCAQYGIKIQEVGLQAAQQAVLLEPNDAANYDVMGEIYLRQGDYTSAERFFLQALNLDKNFASAHLHLAVAYLDQNRRVEALPHLQSAQSLSPGNPIGDQAAILIQQNFPDVLSTGSLP